MSAAYRARIVRWLLSMAVLALGSVMWAVFVLIGATFENEWDFYNLAFRLGALVQALGLILIVMMAWHLADFAQISRPTGSWSARFSGWGLFVGACVIALAAMCAASTEQLWDLFCPRPTASVTTTFEFGFDGCGSITPAWLQTIAVCSLALVLILTITKAIISALTYFRRTEAA